VDPARRRQTARLAAPLVLLSVASAGGTALAPALAGRQPLLLVALCPRAVFVVAAAAHVPAALLLAVTFVRMTVGDPFHFSLGRLHGAGVVRRWGRGMPVRHAGAPLVALSPTGKVLALAGAGGTPVTRVVAADLAGTIVRLTLLFCVGRAAAPWTTAVVSSLTTSAQVVLALLGAAVVGAWVVRGLARWTPAWTMKEATCASW
jgi:membrane protein DedA with SNARE-associated domain